MSIADFSSFRPLPIPVYKPFSAVARGPDGSIVEMHGITKELVYKGLRIFRRFDGKTWEFPIHDNWIFELDPREIDEVSEDIERVWQKMIEMRKLENADTKKQGPILSTERIFRFGFYWIAIAFFFLAIILILEFLK